MANRDELIGSLGFLRRWVEIASGIFAPAGVNYGKTAAGAYYIPQVDADGQLQVDVLTAPAVTVSLSAVDQGAAGVAAWPVTDSTTQGKIDTTNTKLSGGLPAALTAGGGVKVGVVDALPAGSNTLGKTDQGAAGASAWLVTDSTTQGKIDSTNTLLSGGLPAALTGGGGVKVGVVDALPAGTNTVGKIDQGTGGASAWLVDSELPAAGALADGASNPTTPTVGAALSGYNGSTWDRLRTAIVAKTSTFTGLLNTIPLARYNATAPTPSDGDVLPLQSDSAGRLRTVPPSWGTVACGELAGATSATVMPTVACSLIKFKAAYDNAGRVYIGGSGVTKADGTTDTTTGLQLSAGEETSWLPVTNANLFYRICDNAGDDLTYVALA